MPGNLNMGLPVAGASRASQETIVRRALVKIDDALPLSVRSFGPAPGTPPPWDGNSHPLSDYFGSLGAAQAVYPHATALTNEVDWAATQGALNASGGQPVVMPVGTGVWDRPLARSTTTKTWGGRLRGAGMLATRIDNRVANGGAVDFDGGATATFQWDTELSHFSIITTTSPANSDGIRLRANWYFSIHRVAVEGLSGDGIVMRNLNADSDSNSFGTIEAAVIRNGRWGIKVEDPAAGTGASSGNTTIQNSFVVLNASGGIRLLGVLWTILGTSIASNGGVGLDTPYVAVAGGVQDLKVQSCEFDTNATSHCHFENLTGGKVSLCRFVFGTTVAGIAAGSPAIGIHAGVDGGSGECRNLHVEIPRMKSVNSAVVTFMRVGNTATGTWLKDEVNDNPTLITALVNNGTRTRWTSNGIDYWIREGVVAPSAFSGNATYIPSLMPSGAPADAGGRYHRLQANAAMTLTIANPSMPEYSSFVGQGDPRLSFILVNNGGALTLAWGSLYRVTNAGTLAPAVGKYKVLDFLFDVTSGAFRLVSAGPDVDIN